MVDPLAFSLLRITAHLFQDGNVTQGMSLDVEVGS